MKITTTVELIDSDVISGIFEAGLNYSATPWWVDFIRVNDFSWDIKYCAPDDEDIVDTQRITLDDIAGALTQILSRRLWHCGEPVTTDIEDWDSCVADLILQFAVFGDEVYG